MKAKNIISVLLIAFVVVSIFAVLNRTSSTPISAVEKVAPGQPAATPTASNAPVPERQVTAIYFMTDVRCASCVKIETWSHDAITTAFKDELASGLLKWEMLNYEEEANAHYVKEYGLITKSVVLVEHLKGEETRFKNLPEIWNLLGDQEVFAAYVTEELRLFLDPGTENKPAASEPG